MFIGASHFSKALDVLRYEELAGASVCFWGHIWSSIGISLRRIWCCRIFLCAHLDFAAGVSFVDQDYVDLSVSSILPCFILGDACKL